MRLNNVEFRYSKSNKAWELIEWYKDKQKEYCCVIAFFDMDSEGYNMRTVGERFFEAGQDAFIVGKHAMNFLVDLFLRDNQEAADE